MNKVRVSKWHSLNVCVNCEISIGNQKRMYSGGICPHCGYLSIGTICNTRKIVIKEIKNHPWWRFWNRDFTYIGKNEHDNNWLLSDKH